MVDTKILNPLYQDLIHEIKEENHQQILKISENILNKVPNEHDVLICKIIALLKLSKFDQATPLLNQQPIKGSHPILPFAYCYYLYKTGKYEECITQIKKQDLTNNQYQVGFMLLEAQSRYKLNDYAESSDLYLNILQNAPIDEESVEILVNLMNSVILENSNNYEPVIKIANNYISKLGGELIREFFFNLSLLHSNINNLKSSMNYLNKFKQIVEQEDDLVDDSETQNDLLMYDIQADFINNLLYEFSIEEIEAKIEKYTNKLDKKIDEYYKILVQNNIICLRATQKDVADSIRKLDEIISKSQSSAKFTKAQILSFKVNKLILYLNKNKYSESSKLIEEIEKAHDPIEYYSNSKYLSAKYYLLFKTKKYKEIENLHQIILEAIEKSNLKTIAKNSIQISIALINGETDRLLGNQKHLVLNLQSLYSFDKSLLENDVLHALLITIISKNFNILNDFKPLVEQIFNSTKNPHILALIAELYIKDKQFNLATQIYERLLDISEGRDIKAIERLCYLYSFSDWKKAKEYLDKIPQIEIISDLNELRRLENDYLPSKSSKVPESKIDVDSKTKKIKKKNRKPRYPKGFDPANPVGVYDKERWLPKNERTKFKKGKKGNFRGPQGGAIAKDTVTTTFKTGPSTANQVVATSKTKAKKKRN